MQENNKKEYLHFAAVVCINCDNESKNLGRLFVVAVGTYVTRNVRASM